MKIFSRKMPDLNWANPILRQRMEAIARQWLDMGIDGFRVDAVAHLARDPEFQDSELPVNAQGLAADWSKFSNLPALFDYLQEFKQTVLGGPGLSDDRRSRGRRESADGAELRRQGNRSLQHGVYV